MTIELTEEQIAAIRVRETPAPITDRNVVSNPAVIHEMLKHMGVLEKEHFIVLTLNTRNHLIAKHTVSVGTIDAALVHPRETYRLAIQDNAAKIIVAHNHPSGEETPSEDDLLITKRLVAAGKVIGIPVLDHVIVGGDSFHSMQEHGQIR